MLLFNLKTKGTITLPCKNLVLMSFSKDALENLGKVYNAVSFELKEYLYESIINSNSQKM